jgi:hypothetical protein
VSALVADPEYSQVKTTSAVKGLLSCQLTPFFSFQVTDCRRRQLPSSRPDRLGQHRRGCRRIPAASGS